MDKDSEQSEGRHKVPVTPPKVSRTRPPDKRRGRRRAGEGSVIRRGDGRWAGRLAQPDGTARWFYGRTQREVEDRLKEALQLRAAGLPLPDSHLTFGAWLTEWLASLPVSGARTKGLKPATIDYYSGYVQTHLLRSELAAKPLAKLEATDLERLYRRMTTEVGEGGLGLSSTTAHHLHAVVHRALAKAVRQGKVARNVAELVDEDARPTVNRQEMRVLADADLERFLEVIRGERLEALYVLAVREGLRQGEILALRWRDVDLDAGVIAITGSLQANRTIGEPKSRHSRRSVVMFPETVAALREHRERQRFEARRAGSMWVDHDLVFPNEFGAHINRSGLTRALDALLRRAQLPDVRFHDLRHSAATDWLKNGMHPKVASERLGHASVGITLDLYSHVTPTMQREAVADITRRRHGRTQPA